MVYLAGQMSGLTLEQMSQWRDEATDLLQENFTVINPVNYYNFEIDPNTYTNREVKKFDLEAVKRSDIILVNLEYPKSIGTAIEVHMAYDVWDKPVVAYGGKKEDLHPWLQDVHPWIQESLTKWCNTLDEAVDYINTFYLTLF